MIDLNNSYKYWNSLMTKGVFQRNVKVEPLKYSWKVVNPKSESYLLSNPSLLSGRDECIYITVLSAGIEPLYCFVSLLLCRNVASCIRVWFLFPGLFQECRQPMESSNQRCKAKKPGQFHCAPTTAVRHSSTSLTEKSRFSSSGSCQMAVLMISNGKQWSWVILQSSAGWDSYMEVQHTAGMEAWVQILFS